MHQPNLAIFTQLAAEVDAIDPSSFPAEFATTCVDSLDDNYEYHKSDLLAHFVGALYCADDLLWDDPAVVKHIAAFILEQFPEPLKDEKGWPVMDADTLYSDYPMTNLYSGEERASQYLFNYQATYIREGLDDPESSIAIRKVFDQMQAWGLIPADVKFDEENAE